MAEGASAITALLASALKNSRVLYDEIAGLKNYRKSIRDIQENLMSLGTLLGEIQEEATDTQSTAWLTALQLPLHCCNETCFGMHEMLASCTPDCGIQPRVREWLNMRFKGKSFDNVKSRLESYHMTLLIAFQAAKM